LALTLVVLTFGGPIEQALERRFGSKDGGGQQDPNA